MLQKKHKPRHGFLAVDLAGAEAGRVALRPHRNSTTGHPPLPSRSKLWDLPRRPPEQTFRRPNLQYFTTREASPEPIVCCFRRFMVLKKHPLTAGHSCHSKQSLQSPVDGLFSWNRFSPASSGVQLKLWPHILNKPPLKTDLGDHHAE